MDFTQLHRDIINRKAGGKTIWQPRIECWYTDRQYRAEPLPGRFKDASVLELYNRLGVSKRLYEFNACIETEYDPAGRIETERREIDPTTFEEQIHTPVGSVNCIHKRNSSNYGTMPQKWWIETAEDLKVYIYIEAHTRFRFNQNTYNTLVSDWGHLGLPCLFIPRVNIQRLFIDLAGVENTIFMLSDEEDLVQTYIKTVDACHMRLVELLCETPFEWINFGDNIHSKVLSPKLFEKYVLPAYQQRNHRLHQAGKFTFAHFDGDVKELFPYFQACGLNGIEAITPRPQGDVSLAEAKRAMGDLFLIDGIAAILFDDLYPLEQLKQQAEECMHLFEGQLVLGISDEMSSTGTIDRIEVVRELVEKFNATR